VNHFVALRMDGGLMSELPAPEARSVDSQLFAAARDGDVSRLTSLLDLYPDKLSIRMKPYESTLLHLAAQHPRVIELLIARGMDVNARESGDNTYAMHWAAAAGQLDVVRMLTEAGGDVIGRGDDHQLEVIGWATCWDGGDDPTHRAVAEFLIGHGAHHHIFSAIALNLVDEVLRIVAAERNALNRRMSRNENNQLPLHFAVRKNRPEMVSLLIELGADPLGVDGSGYPAAAYAIYPDVDRPVMEAISTMTSAEMLSAQRAHREPQLGMIDLLAALALRDWETAQYIWNGSGDTDNHGDVNAGALHIMAKRGDRESVAWLLQRGANPNTRWAHWDSDVTPMHLAVFASHTDVVRVLLAQGADPSIRDTKHDGSSVDWAEFFGRDELVRVLKSRGSSS
jgi:ankyrin repeat protein